jgi:hypothetical protein
MPSSRRQVIRQVGGAALASAASGLALSRGAVARGRGALVIVRTDLGLRAVDPRTGDVDAWDGPPPAVPAPDLATPAPIPAAVDTPVTEGRVGYWMASPNGGAFVFRVDTGASSEWCWRRDGARSVPLGLPDDLEPAFLSGTSARWFHGATVDAAHLGSGTLRLLAVDIETGEIVLDHDQDRRLELAATRVSDDGAIVAHVQGGNTGVAFWAADLRGGTRLSKAEVNEAPGVAAASAIDLAVAPDGDAALIAAGLRWDAPGAPTPTVYIMRAEPSDATTMLSLPGELVGIVPAANDAAS